MRNSCDVCSCKLLDVTSITVATGTQFQLTITPKTLYDGERYVLRLSQALPVPGENGVEPVTIYDGTTVYPVLDEIGNVLLSGRLRGCRRYEIVYGTNTPHFLAWVCDKCLKYYPGGAITG